VMALSDQGLGDHQWLMDSATGEIHLWSDDGGVDGAETVDGDDLDERGLRETVPMPLRPWYEIMAVADELSDDKARAELHVALHGKGAFRRFRGVVHQRHPGVIGLWRDYEEARGRLIAVDCLPLGLCLGTDVGPGLGDGVSGRRM